MQLLSLSLSLSVISTDPKVILVVVVHSKLISGKESSIFCSRLSFKRRLYCTLSEKQAVSVLGFWKEEETFPSVQIL